ncbi:odorant receptor 13a-like [Anopheles maculipalpis]|uniref:odorant receptor 13a-like n=1 Tax=Anopheles maculipalpis TaxID=1496333 RepID=UPI0021598B57|nr:odorant receptor 13a-like [Anopheles maculipalpis]
MVRLVLHEVRHVLMAMFYISRCLTAKIQNSNADKYIYWFLTMIPIAMLCIPQFAYLLVDSKGLIEFVSVLVPFTEILLTNLKMIICNIKRQKIINLINEIQAEWTEYQKSDNHEIQSLITATVKRTRIFVIVYTTVFVIICLEYASMPLFKFVYHNLFSKSPSNFTVTIPYSSRFFYSTEIHTSFSLTYFFVMVGVYLLALTLSGFDSLFSTLAMHITTMFKFLKIEIDQLGLDMRAGTGRAEIRDKMKRIILKHKINLSLIEQLEDGFSFYLMVQFLTSSIVVCVVLYELTIVFGWNEDTFKTLTYLPGAILQLFLFCWYAQNITEEANLVADHIYNIPWYLSDTPLQKTILTFMVKAQKPTGVTASKFYMVTLQSFQRISSTSYSYFTLLQTINQQ